MRSRRSQKNRPLVVTVFGTRPQFIKLAVLWRALESRFRSVLIDSGQHYDWNMAGVFHNDTHLRLPDIHLRIKSASAASQIGRVADELDAHLARLNPDAVIVIGDTSTTAGGAIAGAYRGIQVAHVEAGLRSYDKNAPEEKNRIIADHLARWKFCPTKSAAENLRREGITQGVFRVGDLMYEHWLAQQSSPVALQEVLPHGISGAEYYFMTAHRAENVDSPSGLRNLIRIIRLLDRPVVYAIHPRTCKNLKRFGLWSNITRIPGLHLLPPVPYSSSLVLLANARAVLTDSGGVQREAYWSRVPCLILREVTEWPELVESRNSVLVGLDQGRVRAALRRRSPGCKVLDRSFRLRHPSHAITACLGRELG